MSDIETIDVEARARLAINAGSPGACGRGFVRHIEKLVFPSLPNIAGLRCRYDVSVFNDALYASFGITCPENIRLAVTKRRAEYLAGRHLGRILLSERGLPTRIASGNDRQPLWCAGWIGSIAHTDDVAVCCTASQAQSSILGIDVEHWFGADTAASVR